MIKKLLALLLLISAPVGAQVCTGVGYKPVQFAGKPDPWPNNHPLPNDQLAAAYFARYGQHPGNPSVPEGKPVPGYFDELNFVTYSTLENAGNASSLGPGGEVLHPGCPTTTEQTDFAFSVPKGSPYVYQWYVSNLDGSSPLKAIKESLPEQACGIVSIPKSLFGYWTIYYNNIQPCGNIVDLCGNGKIDPNETCVTCPQDVGPCSTPQCPILSTVPDSLKIDCLNLLQAFKLFKGTGKYSALKNVCNQIQLMKGYSVTFPLNFQGNPIVLNRDSVVKFNLTKEHSNNILAVN